MFALSSRNGIVLICAFPSEVWNWRLIVYMWLDRHSLVFNKNANNLLGGLRTFFRTVLTDSSKDVYTFAITWIMVLLFWTRLICDVCIWNSRVSVRSMYLTARSIYRSICTVFIFGCADSVFLRGVSSFENEERARFLSWQRTPGWNRRWRHQRWPQFNSVN